MGFRARKSFKIAPGVRMTVSKSGISASAGVRGARITKSTSGRTTTSVGIPGSGIHYTTSRTAGGKAQRTRQIAQPARGMPSATPKPGVMAPKWEKELYKALRSDRFDRLEEIAQSYPESMPVVVVLDALATMDRGDTNQALVLCRAAWRTPADAPIEDHPFVRKYIGASELTVSVAEGVAATLPISRDAVGLALAELEQYHGNVDAAMAVVEQLDPSPVAAVSLGELYIQVGRYDDVIDITNGITNSDDPTALLNAYRGIAFREQGHHTAAREAFKEALKSKSRDAGVRHFALVERAKVYIAEGKQAMARKDLERVLMENADYRGVRELLADGGNISAEAIEAGSPRSAAPIAADAAHESADVVWTTPTQGAMPAPDTELSAAPADAGDRAGVLTIKFGSTRRHPAPLPDLEADGVHVSFDGNLLRIVATSRRSAVALLGPGHREGQVELTRDQVAEARFTAAGRFGGCLDIYTHPGTRHRVYFQSKQRAQPWRELAEMLSPPL